MLPESLPTVVDDADGIAALEGCVDDAGAVVDPVPDAGEEVDSGGGVLLQPNKIRPTLATASRSDCIIIPPLMSRLRSRYSRRQQLPNVNPRVRLPGQRQSMEPRLIHLRSRF